MMSQKSSVRQILLSYLGMDPNYALATGDIEPSNVISSFDHKQRYGLPAPIDAKKYLRQHLAGKTLTAAAIDRESGDLHFLFANAAKLQIFAFSSYEMWEISFPDGPVEYANYARR